MKIHSVFFLLIISIQICQGQNLIVNPDAESDPLGVGWTSVATGTSCGSGSNWRMLGGSTTYPASQAGSYFFFSGCGSVSGEIYQDIDVSSHAAVIDLGFQVYIFSGYTHSFNQSPADGARIIVEYSNASSTVLSSYDTGYTTNTSGWMVNSDSRTTPIGTRNIRIRLLSQANNGSSVDGYFDNLSLTLSPSLPIELMYFTAEITQQGLVELNWETAQEQNNDFFTVERAIHETDWETIEIIDGAALSKTGVAYRTIDPAPYQHGVSYYRLTQTDLGGTVTYSHSVRVQMSDWHQGGAYIFPNPANDMLTIVGNQQESSAIHIFSIHGTETTDFVVKSSPNSSNRIIDITPLQPGFYLIRAGTNSFKFYKY